MPVKETVVHSEQEQTNIFEGLAEQMMQQGQLIGIPQVPGQVDMNTGTTPPANGNAPKQSAGDKAGAKVSQGINQGVTANVANTGQLIPIAPPVAPGGSGVSDDISDLKRIVGQVAGGSNPAEGAEPKSDSGGGGLGAIGDIAQVAMSFIGWIICTELVLQGKMPRKWWVKGARVFASYPDVVKQGYYLWAIPCVHHLRNRPNSYFSRVLMVVFNARARSIAEDTTIQGTAVTLILYPVCWVLGTVMKLVSINFDYTSVYKVRD